MAPTHKQKDPINITAGRRLRLKRELAGLSQSALGKVFDISRIKIGQYESGQSAIPASTLLKLSQFLNTDINFFFQSETENSALSELTSLDSVLNKESISLLRDFETLDSPEVRKKFAAVMERAAELLVEKK